MVSLSVFSFFPDSTGILFKGIAKGEAKLLRISDLNPNRHPLGIIIFIDEILGKIIVAWRGDKLRINNGQEPIFTAGRKDWRFIADHNGLPYAFFSGRSNLH